MTHVAKQSVVPRLVYSHCGFEVLPASFHTLIDMTSLPTMNPAQQAAFDAAQNNAPSVIFIDDSDLIFESGQEHGLYRCERATRYPRAARGDAATGVSGCRCVEARRGHRWFHGRGSESHY